MSRHFRWTVRALLLLAALVASVPPASVAGAESRQVTFTLEPPGIASQANNTFLVAARLRNTSDRDAFQVQIHSIQLKSEPAAARLTPTAFPLVVGELDAGQGATLQASFDGSQLTLGTPYLLVMNGSYRPVNRGTDSDRGHVFTASAVVVLPPAAPGSASFRTVTLEGRQVSGAPFLPQPPEFDDEVNRPRAPVPTAPFVPGTPTATPTSVVPVPFHERAAIALGVGNVVFDVNNGLGINDTNDNPIAEPSGASGGGVVFVSANAYAAYSTDGGSHFTKLDPTTIFPNDLGFCCDQIVQYAPTIDRFIWLMQGPVAPGAKPHGYRLAAASPADIISSGGTAWTYWIATPSLFGCVGFDYPDLSVGTNYLYMGWDAEGGGCSNGLMVARTSLTGLQTGGQITVDFTDPTDGALTRGSHLTQNTSNAVFWAGHNGSNTVRVYSWAEGPQPYSWVDVGISSWANGPASSLTPDGKDWLQFGSGFPGSNIIGATRSGTQVWFAWLGGTNGTFQQPHIEMVVLEQLFGLHKLSQMQIWNNSYAFAYPALTTNRCTGEIGLSFEYGGNGNYQNHVVGFWGDFVAYITTGSDVGTTRFGDYVTIRQAPPTDANPGNLFDAFGYGLNKVPAAAGNIPDVHYVRFGRPASSCVPIPIPR